MAKILPDIKITEEELEAIRLDRNNDDYGSEGLIIKGDNKRRVRKIFYDNFGMIFVTQEEVEKVSQNKLKKLQKLYQIKSFDNDVKIQNTISCNNRLVGYDMVSQKINYPYKTAPIPKEEKIKFLKQVKKKLEYFHSMGIVYGDVKADNILIDKRNKSISFCDLDNIQIDENPIDMYNKHIYNFQDENRLLDKNTDYYMFNLLLLNELLYEHYDYEYMIRRLKKDVEMKQFHNIFNEKGMENIKKLVNVKKKYNGRYLIDNLKK